MKQLKKISLQKEELVSLNSPQMDLIRGGFDGIYVDYYDPNDPYLTNFMDYLLDYGYVGYTSQWIIQGACLMKPVYVYP